jgi:hypothetical protein
MEAQVVIRACDDARMSPFRNVGGVEASNRFARMFLRRNSLKSRRMRRFFFPQTLRSLHTVS